MLEISHYSLVAATILIVVALAAYVVAFTTQAPERDRELVHAGGGGDAYTPSGVPESEAGLHSAATPHGLVWYSSRLTWLVLFFLTMALATRAMATGHGPFANQHEFAVSFAWGMVAAYIYFEWRYRVRTLSLLMLPITAAMLFYSFSVDTAARPLVPALQNNFLLTLHVATAVFAYGAFAVSFAVAVFYLVRPHLKWRGLPKPALLDEIGYRAAVIGYPLLTVMIILGAIWADIAWGRYWSWDPKETAAFVTWLIYSAYLHARVARDWRGDRAAWLLILGFAAILFTYYGNLFFGGLHGYA